MKITITQFEDHSEVRISEIPNSNDVVHTFDEPRESRSVAARAFVAGFQESRSLANKLIQSMPSGYTKIMD